MISQRRLLFLLFAISGFCGLIYESIWSHYLKLFLGHAAYAQTLVLAIFMGGMALGAWLCGAWSTRWKNLLLVYAAAEAAIGIAALLFHDVFTAFIAAAYDSWIPALGDPTIITLFKWGAAALLILPQSILLGMTFPLMSAGVIRRYPSDPGATVSMLYFTNSIGAAVGVLISGFVLIAWIGLPGAIRVAGFLNLALAAVVWLLFRTPETRAAFPGTLETTAGKGEPLFYLFLLIAALTGTASFIYEIVWIRMLNLVLGSSTHAFELMLSAFILGLALGGLWIRRRIDRIAQPTRFLAVVQLVMGALALATLFLYNQTFDVMAWLMGTLQKNNSGYAWFNFASHAIAGAIMLPATFFAGMTLPLLTYTLIKRGHGEQSIGAIYASNTLGAIIGVFFTTHVGLPLLGLKGVLSIGGAVDIALGLVLLWRFREIAQRHVTLGATFAGVAVVVATLLFGRLDALKMASGVYRYGILLDPNTSSVTFHKDGKTASIDMVLDKGSGDLRIATNGKPDAMISMAPGRVSPDEPTMIFAAALPLAMNPRATTAAVIGMGSGLSTHTLLSANVLQQVDTIEIESGIIEAAQGFRPRVDLAYTDPRSHIHIDDAKTYFSTHNKKYDIVLSEPSNPWVSGTSTLFTDEFYTLVKKHLVDGGVLVQWLQTYEINEGLIATVVKALSQQFSDYEFYSANDVDLLILAKNGGALTEPDFSHLPRSALYDNLARVSVRDIQDVLRHRIGDKQAIDALFASYPLPANSDYYPVLDQNAARARFLKNNAYEFIQLTNAYLPALEMLGQPAPARPDTVATPSRHRWKVLRARTMPTRLR